jgi:hypothetical protein
MNPLKYVLRFITLFVALWVGISMKSFLWTIALVLFVELADWFFTRPPRSST